MRLIKYSYKMLLLNSKIYINLIRVLVISFAFILGVLGYFDGKIYNENSFILSRPKELITISNPSQKALKKIKKIEAKNKSNFFEVTVNGSEWNGITYEVYYVPNNMSQIYLDDYTYIDIDNCNKKNKLKNNEIYLEKKLYTRVKNKKIIKIPIKTKNGKSFIKEYRIKGFFEKKGLNNNEIEDEYRYSVIVSSDDNCDYFVDSQFVVIFSQKSDLVAKQLEQLGVSYNSVLEWQNDAKSEIKSKRIITSIILIFLYIILGINVRSISENTLEKRKFEIAVQRTIGAEKREIAIQFIIENAIITMIAVLISIGINYIIFLIAKIIYALKGEQFTIYVSSYSMILFFVTTLFIVLNIICSFVRECLKVEIVKYLKE